MRVAQPGEDPEKYTPRVMTAWLAYNWATTEKNLYLERDLPLSPQGYPEGSHLYRFQVTINPPPTFNPEPTVQVWEEDSTKTEKPPEISLASWVWGELHYHLGNLLPKGAYPLDVYTPPGERTMQVTSPLGSFTLIVKGLRQVR